MDWLLLESSVKLPAIMSGWLAAKRGRRADVGDQVTWAVRHGVNAQLKSVPPGTREDTITRSMWKELSVEHSNMLVVTPEVGVENSMVMLFQVEKAAEVSSMILQTTPSSDGAIPRVPI